MQGKSDGQETARVRGTRASMLKCKAKVRDRDSKSEKTKSHQCRNSSRSILAREARAISGGTQLALCLGLES